MRCILMLHVISTCSKIRGGHRVTGWRRPTGCLVFEVIFRKTALKLVALLRKETCNLRHPVHFRHHLHRGSTQIIFREALCNVNLLKHAGSSQGYAEGEVGGWGRVPFSRNLMSPTPRRKWYLTTERRAH